VKSLIDRFRTSKPDWQSPDPMVRAEAVLRLPSAERDVLLTLAREDPEARVRRAAARKLADAEILTRLATADEDEGVREEAASRLVHLAIHAAEAERARLLLGALRDSRHLAVVARSAAHPGMREAAVGALDDPRALASVAREADDPATRLLAVGRIGDVPTLLSLALKSDHKAVAVAAVERLEDERALREVAEGARVGAAARRARARLETAEPVPAPPAAAASPEAEERERQAYERARAEQEREAEERARRVREREELCGALEHAEGEGVPAEVERVRAAWEALAPLPGPDGEGLAARLEGAAEEARRRHEAWRAGLARRDELAALVARAEELATGKDLGAGRSAWNEVRRQWNELVASADQPDLTARFEEAAKRRHARERASVEEREREQRANAARLTALAERAEALVALEDLSLRDAQQAARELRAALDHPGHFPGRHDREQVLARLERARKELFVRLQQLREDAEWKRWANIDVQEELCARAEALVGETDVEKAARELRDLDARWKQAKEAPKDRAEELWTRFKAARDTVHGRISVFLARQAEEQAGNLRRKQSLCERAEVLAESTDWVRTADELRQLQAEWKTIGPVPAAQSRRVWQRFRRPCDRFFSRWHEHRAQRGLEWAEHLARKESLCERAEALQESTDWEATSAELRRLQAEWRTIGAVRKSRSEAVWLRFRKACDHFFERYKHRDSLALERAREARERICAELESIDRAEGEGDKESGGPAALPEDLVGRVLAAQTAWRQAGELPTDLRAPLDERFDRARQRLLERFPAGFAGSELDPEASRRKAEKLIARVEGLLHGIAPAGGAAEAGSAQELAARLRDALAANTMGGRAAADERWHSATSEVESARAAWRRLGPLPGPQGRDLLERFEAACRRFFDQRPRSEQPRAPAERRTRSRA